MRNLKLKCPQCNKVFRTRNGLAWHLLHRHDYKLSFDSFKREVDKRAFELMPFITKQRYLELIKTLTTVMETMTRLRHEGKPIPDDLKHRREELERQLEEIQLEFGITS